MFQPDDDGPSYEEPGCCAVNGGTGPACSEECERIEHVARVRRFCKGFYAAARAAMKMARRYQDEEDAIFCAIDWRGDLRDVTADATAEFARNDKRIADCVRQVNAYRANIRALRATLHQDVDAILDVAIGEDLATMDTWPAPAEVAE